MTNHIIWKHRQAFAMDSHELGCCNLGNVKWRHGTEKNNGDPAAINPSASWAALIPSSSIISLFTCPTNLFFFELFESDDDG